MAIGTLMPQYALAEAGVEVDVDLNTFMSINAGVVDEIDVPCA